MTTHGVHPAGLTGKGPGSPRPGSAAHSRHARLPVQRGPRL